jgi:hypothetical protein
MPKGGGKWSTCQISKLDAWIQGGYKQWELKSYCL